jgi:hypothetical protein
MNSKKSKYKDFEFVFNARTWRVVFVDKEYLDEMFTEGLCAFDLKVITVAVKGWDIQTVRETLGHEITHVFTEMLRYCENEKYDNEMVAEMVGKGLAQVAWQLPKWFYKL